MILRTVIISLCFLSGCQSKRGPQPAENLPAPLSSITAIKTAIHSSMQQQRELSSLYPPLGSALTGILAADPQELSALLQDPLFAHLVKELQGQGDLSSQLPKGQQYPHAYGLMIVFGAQAFLRQSQLSLAGPPEQGLAGAIASHGPKLMDKLSGASLIELERIYWYSFALQAAGRKFRSEVEGLLPASSLALAPGESTVVFEGRGIATLFDKIGATLSYTSVYHGVPMAMSTYRLSTLIGELQGIERQIAAADRAKGSYEWLNLDIEALKAQGLINEEQYKKLDTLIYQSRTWGQAALAKVGGKNPRDTAQVVRNHVKFAGLSEVEATSVARLLDADHSARGLDEFVTNLYEADAAPLIRMRNLLQGMLNSGFAPFLKMVDTIWLPAIRPEGVEQVFKVYRENEADFKSVQSFLVKMAGLSDTDIQALTRAVGELTQQKVFQKALATATQVQAATVSGRPADNLAAAQSIGQFLDVLDSIDERLFHKLAAIGRELTTVDPAAVARIANLLSPAAAPAAGQVAGAAAGQVEVRKWQTEDIQSLSDNLRRLFSVDPSMIKGVIRIAKNRPQSFWLALMNSNGEALPDMAKRGGLVIAELGKIVEEFYGGQSRLFGSGDEDKWLHSAFFKLHHNKIDADLVDGLTSNIARRQRLFDTLGIDPAVRQQLDQDFADGRSLAAMDQIQKSLQPQDVTFGPGKTIRLNPFTAFVAITLAAGSGAAVYAATTGGVPGLSLVSEQSDGSFERFMQAIEQAVAQHAAPGADKT